MTYGGRRVGGRAPRAVVKWAGAWAAVLAGGAIGAGGALVAGVWLPGPWAEVLGGVLAAAAAAGGGRARRWLDAESEAGRRLAGSLAVTDRRGRVPRVGDVADLLAAGVHPYVADDPAADRAAAPPYVLRDVDTEFHRLLAEGGFVLVLGESAAGKSRMAFEGVRALFPGHAFAAPDGRQALEPLLARLPRAGATVLWLDDLERFLGPAGLTPSALTRVGAVPGGRVVVVATMRMVEYDRYRVRTLPAGTDEDGSGRRAALELLTRARTVRLPRLWSGTERHRAAGFADDPRIAGALRHADRFGIAETLAAAPELERDWRQAWAVGGHPRGAALVTAAIDCRRAGMDDPVGKDLLETLHRHYLAAAGGAALRPEPLDAAWAWAVQPVSGASSLLMPAGPDADDPHYLAFDYLLDLPDHRPVPGPVWDLLIDTLDPSQAERVAADAFWRYRPAFHRAVARGVANDPLALAQEAADLRRHREAVRLLTQEIARCGGERGAPWTLRHRCAFHRMLAGETEAAAMALRELIAEGPDDDTHVDDLHAARHNLANCTARLGDVEEALVQFGSLLEERTRLLGAHHLNTLATRGTIALLHGQAGRTHEAIRLLRDVLADEQTHLGPDHTNTMGTQVSLAASLAAAHRYAEAVALLTDVLPGLAAGLGTDHPEVRDAGSLLTRCAAEAERGEASAAGG